MNQCILSVLVAPLYNADHFFDGTRLENLDIKMDKVSRSKMGKTIKCNNNPRYHFLKMSEDINIVDSIIDFKHYFSVDISYLMDIKDNSFLCSVKELYREQICQRFSNFLSRIGLPEPQTETPPETYEKTEGVKLWILILLCEVRLVG